MVYQWRGGTHIKVDAAIAAEELKRIRDRDGKIDPSVVVKEARPSKSRLHSAFEWDDTVAADEFRRDQARYMIRSLVAVDGEAAEEAVPVYVNVRESVSQPGYYQDVQLVAENPDEWTLVMRDAGTALVSAQKKLNILQSLAKDKGRKAVGLIKKATAGVEHAREAITQLVG